LNLLFNFIFLISIFLINLKFFGIFKDTTKLERMELQVYLILYLFFLNALWPVFHSIFGNKFIKKREIKIELIKKLFIYKIHSRIYLNLSFNFIFLISIFLINLKFFGIFKVTTKLESMELQVYLILYMLFLNALWPVFHSIFGNKFIKKKRISHFCLAKKNNLSHKNSVGYYLLIHNA
jgi:uncharacterized membrane protein YwzB